MPTIDEETTDRVVEEAQRLERDAEIRNLLTPIGELLDYQPVPEAREVREDACKAFARIVQLLAPVLILCAVLLGCSEVHTPPAADGGPPAVDAGPVELDAGDPLCIGADEACLGWDETSVLFDCGPCPLTGAGIDPQCRWELATQNDCAFLEAAASSALCAGSCR